MEHAASVAKTFLTSDAVVVDFKEVEQPVRMPMPIRKPLRRPGNVTFSLASPNRSLFTQISSISAMIHWILVYLSAGIPQGGMPLIV